MKFKHCKKAYVLHSRCFSFLKRYTPNDQLDLQRSLLFLPGGWEPSSAWESTAAHFARRGHRTAILDYRDLSTVDEGVLIVNESIEELGPSTIVISHCVGAFIAQKYFGQRGIAGSGIVLVNPFPPQPVTCLNRLLKVDNKDAFVRGLRDFEYHGFYRSLLGKPGLVLPIEDLFGIDQENPNWEMLQQQVVAPYTNLILDMYDQVIVDIIKAIPCLVIASQLDKIVTYEDAVATSTFHHAETRILRNANHLFIMNQPECAKDFYKLLADWISKNRD